jgi:hypothetical protein
LAQLGPPAPNPCSALCAHDLSRPGRPSADVPLANQGHCLRPQRAPRYSPAMAEVKDQPSTDAAPAADTTTPRAEGRPTWKPTSPDDQPPEKLIEARLAHDRQQMERLLDHLLVHDPALRQDPVLRRLMRNPHVRSLMREMMVAARSYEAELMVAERWGHADDNDTAAAPRPNGLECFLVQGDAALNFIYGIANSIPSLRKLDLTKAMRAGLSANRDYLAGSEVALAGLRGKAPNTTNAAVPSAATERAVIAYCVHRLSIGAGGFARKAAAKHVETRAKDSKLKRTWMTVLKNYYAITAEVPRDPEGAAFFKILVDRLGIGAECQKQRLSWLEKADIFEKL